MQLNMDFTQRVVIDTAALPWESSPTAGVERRMLERGGKEAGRATSVVRYAPQARFPYHRHGGGEEFLVLEGTFADEHGIYPAGTYVRNPIGSSHTPFTKAGCTILVKLCQMTDAVETRLVVNTRDRAWDGLSNMGCEMQPLYRDLVSGERVFLVRLHPSAPEWGEPHPDGAEAFVLEGTFDDEDGHYTKGTWLRWPMGHQHQPHSTEGCLLWVKRGHLGCKD